jgi:two-component system OmpR family sensor kinase
MSIRLRLTLWYVGLLGAVLILFGLVLYSVLARSMMNEVDGTIQTRAQQVTSSIEVDPVLLSLRGVVILPPVDPFASTGVFVQVTDREGEIVARSENLADRLLPLEPARRRRILQGQAEVYTLQAGETRLRIFTAPLPVGTQFVGVIQVAASLYEMDATLQRLAYVLAGGIGLALLVAAIFGALLARAALRPIDEITRTALHITHTDDLSRRLERVGPHDEVGRLAATFNEMLARLENLFHTQQRFIADVSHELRTPLTTIRGNVDLLRRLNRVDQNSLRAIEHEADRMARLVADLLLLAQADAGVKLEKEPVELDTLLLEVYRQACLLANEVAVTLGHEDQAVVLGDADRLKQLLLNLVENALKYTPPGGEVTLSLHRENGWVRVAVADTGIGIPAEDLPHIFERFYRVDKARSREKGGTGLGLSIAQWIAHVHEGRIEVESEVGRGSTFTIWLPEKGIMKPEPPIKM